MFRKGLFILAHQCGDTSFYPTYKKLVRDQWKPYEELKRDQEKQLRHLIGFSYENVPYYRNLFKRLGLLPKDVQTVEDLEKLPILTKDIIKKHWEEFKPVNLSSMKYYDQATGGTMGTPFTYRLSKRDRFLSGALLYRGWGYGGYELGDRMVFLAGSSLGFDTKSRLATFLHETARNLKKLSSFDMGGDEMQMYSQSINSFEPRFIRGYASSIYFFTKWIEENNLAIHPPVAVFTTSDNLFPHMRTKISEVFGCEIYDGYGLNDGGVGAYECSEHAGLHIDTERSIMEVVDNEGRQIDRGEGRILATSLHNYSMPFIRYATGDDGHIIDDGCGCGRRYPLLKEIGGRTTDVLFTPEGKNIHGWFFLYIFWDYGKGIKEYQVVQETRERIVIKIVPEEGFDKSQLDNIREVVARRSPGWDIKFKCVDAIDRSHSGKYKFIVNNAAAVNDMELF